MNNTQNPNNNGLNEVSNGVPGATQQGSYQYTGNTGYNNYNPAGANNQGANPPKKKKKKGKKILATFLALVIVAGLGGGGVYVAKKKDISLSDILKSKDKEDAATTQATEETNDQQEEQLVVATDVSALVEKTMPSIVSIENRFMIDLEDYGYEEGEALNGGSGSGVIIGQNDEELLIVTNYHVVEGADDLTVQFVNGTNKVAFIKGSNSGMDLAVIAVPLTDVDDATMNAISIATMGDSDDLRLGEPAIAIGNALGMGQSVTVGVISALNRTLPNEDGSEGLFIQTDAPINPGNSGGALLNINGELIGINSRKLVLTEAEGMGYAIPISIAKPIIEDLMDSSTKYKASKENRGYLGVTAYTPTGVEGAYISSIESGSAAEDAGLEVGDVIIKVEDAKIASRGDLDANLAYYEAGQTITITVLRKGDNGYTEVEVQVTLKEQKSSKSGSSSDKDSSSKKDSDDDKGSDDYEDGGDYEDGDDYEDDGEDEGSDPEGSEDEDGGDDGDDFGF